MRLPIINWLTAFSSIHSSFSFPKQMRELCWFGHTCCVKSSTCWFWKESGDAFLWKFYPSTSNILQIEVTSEETYLQMPTWLPYIYVEQTDLTDLTRGEMENEKFSFFLLTLPSPLKSLRFSQARIDRLQFSSYCHVISLMWPDG